MGPFLLGFDYLNIMMFKRCVFFLIACASFTSCRHNPSASLSKVILKDSLTNITAGFDQHCQTIHVIVALCDNKYQGIVPVPAKIGNGQDPDRNLYWGNNYGVRAYFKKSNDWKLISHRKIDSVILERLVFKHSTRNFYLIADAYNGKYIRKGTKDFLYSCSGQLKDTVHADNKILGINGNSPLLAYIGHDGLMDFRLSELITNKDGKKRKCIILACISKKYFEVPIREGNATPLIWTSQLMCPEAYTLHDAIVGYLNNESPDQIIGRAAKAYGKYQKCSDAEARSILTTGW